MKGVLSLYINNLTISCNLKIFVKNRFSGLSHSDLYLPLTYGPENSSPLCAIYQLNFTKKMLITEKMLYNI